MTMDMRKGQRNAATHSKFMATPSRSIKTYAQIDSCRSFDTRESANVSDPWMFSCSGF